jgi:hypothetical protein
MIKVKVNLLQLRFYVLQANIAECASKDRIDLVDVFISMI